MVSKICNALVWLILLAVLITAGLLLVPRLIGYEIYGVLSGSMEPNFHVGSIIYVKPCPPEEVSVGDAITYTFDAQGQDDLMITHRVVEKDDAARQFITKGDANDIVDLAPVAYSRLVGRALHTIPHLGNLTVFMRSRQGIIAGVGVLLVVILLSLVSTLFDGKKKAEPDEEHREESLQDQSAGEQRASEQKTIETAGETPSQPNRDQSEQAQPENPDDPPEQVPEQ